MRKLDRLTKAETSCREAIQLKPILAEAHNNLGTVQQDLGRLAEAEASYREAIRLKPDYALAHSNLLFCLNYMEELSPAIALEEAKSYGTVVSGKAEPKYCSWFAEANPGKLRIGLVSGDFRNHPVGYFLEGLLRHMDKGGFELLAYDDCHRG